jgi:hypothetical protein
MAPAKSVPADDSSLKRLGGGRWQTRDARFTIEPQSGTWVVVDAEQTDDFGMALVRGPFPSLTAAKEAIASSRASAPAESPLVERIERRRTAPPKDPAPTTPPPKKRPLKRAAPDDERAAPDDDRAPSPDHTGSGRRGSRAPEAVPTSRSRSAAARPGAEAPSEPRWLTDLEPGQRGRARRLVARLVEDGIADAEGLVRRDVVGGVPALAAAALGRRLADLGAHATPSDVAELLADGRDERLDVRWRLVDGEGRPIVLDHSTRRRR